VQDDDRHHCTVTTQGPNIGIGRLLTGKLLRTITATTSSANGTADNGRASRRAWLAFSRNAAFWRTASKIVSRGAKPYATSRLTASSARARGHRFLDRGLARSFRRKHQYQRRQSAKIVLGSSRRIWAKTLRPAHEPRSGRVATGSIPGLICLRRAVLKVGDSRIWCETGAHAQTVPVDTPGAISGFPPRRFFSGWN
jgi:hypothetical protein